MMSTVMSQFTIRLEKLRFFSKIGLFEQERTVGNEFVVDLAVKFNASCFEAEDVTTTINYERLFRIVADIMGREHKLIETVCVEIADALGILDQSIDMIHIKITKLVPPITGITGSASVEYLRTRDNREV